MMNEKVVVTGMGVLSSIAAGKENYFTALIQGKSGAGLIKTFDASKFTTQIAAQILDFNPADFFPPKEARRMDRFTQFGLAAAMDAVKDSGLDVAAFSDDTGVIIGSGIGGLQTCEEAERTLLEKGPGRVSPFATPMMIANMAAGTIAMHFKAKGISNCTVTACAASTHAIGEAFEVIRRGDAQAMICGGAEACIIPLGVAAFCAARALSQRNDAPEKASRPFDKNRDGFLMGEGSGVVVLENEDFAKKRGANILAEISGYGASTDAYHITAPDPDGYGAALCMQRALKKAKLTPDDIDYINAHGTSTSLNDATETKAIKKVFGERAYKIPISSTKSMLGHCLGAAGAMEFIACVLMLQNGMIHPTINYETPDPDCDLDYVPNTARELQFKTALSNSFGFGGHNASLIVRKYE